MAPHRKDGQLDLGPTPMEYLLQSDKSKAGKAKRKEVEEAELLSGPEGMTPLEFAAWQATQAAVEIPTPAPKHEDSPGEGGGSTAPTERTAKLASTEPGDGAEGDKPSPLAKLVAEAEQPVG